MCKLNILYSTHLSDTRNLVGCVWSDAPYPDPEPSRKLSLETRVWLINQFGKLIGGIEMFYKLLSSVEIDSDSDLWLHSLHQPHNVVAYRLHTCNYTVSGIRSVSIQNDLNDLTIWLSYADKFASTTPTSTTMPFCESGRKSFVHCASLSYSHAILMIKMSYRICFIPLVIPVSNTGNGLVNHGKTQNCKILHSTKTIPPA